MITDSLNYTDNIGDTIKLAVEEIEIEGGDVRNGDQGTHLKMWPKTPATLR